MKNVLNSQESILMPEKTLMKELSQSVDVFEKKLEVELKKRRIQAEVSIGGSFAKGTIVKKNLYDIDILVRFKDRKEALSDVLEGVLKSMKLAYTRVHGSRDYFQIKVHPRAIFEIIPVIYITRPSQSENVTDLTHFHVSYVKKHIKGLENEVRLAKQFCQAQGVYGAESYIQGFSGYALECLIIHYKGFEKFLKSVVSAKQPLVVDTAHHYNSKDELQISLNQSKLKSPIIFVDPTFKERNVLAALNVESFEKFQDAARRFLKKPSEGFFIERGIDVEKLKATARKKKAELVRITITTDRQEGDIAGTKLKKFHHFIEHEVGRDFNLIEHVFEYDGEKKGTFYLVATSKKEILKRGPPVLMEKHVKAFRKAHADVFEKNGVLYTKIKLADTLKEFLQHYTLDKKMLKEHAMTSMRVDVLSS